MANGSVTSPPCTPAPLLLGERRWAAGAQAGSLCCISAGRKPRFLLRRTGMWVSEPPWLHHRGPILKRRKGGPRANACWAHDQRIMSPYTATNDQPEQFNLMNQIACPAANLVVASTVPVRIRYGYKSPPVAGVTPG